MGTLEKAPFSQHSRVKMCYSCNKTSLESPQWAEAAWKSEGKEGEKGRAVNIVQLLFHEDQGRFIYCSWIPTCSFIQIHWSAQLHKTCQSQILVSGPQSLWKLAIRFPHLINLRPFPENCCLLLLQWGMLISLFWMEVWKSCTRLIKQK